VKPHSVRPAALVAALLPAILTCSEPLAPAARVTSIVITGPAILRTGTSAPFQARLLDAHGDSVAGVTPTWVSSDTTVATVTALGRVSSLSTGQAVISAHAGHVTGTTTVTVTEWPVVSVQAFPSGDSAFVGDSLRLAALLQDSLGRALTGRVVTWTSSDTTKAAVTATGVVRIRAPGLVTIRAWSEGVAGGAYVVGQARAVLLRLPDTLALRVFYAVTLLPDIEDAAGNRLSDRGVTWQSSDTFLLGVTAGGVLSPHQAGTGALIVRCCGGLADTAVVRIVDQPAGFTIVAGPEHLRVGQVATMTVGVHDLVYAPLDTPIRWASEDTTILSVVPQTDPHSATLTGRRIGNTYLDVATDSLKMRLLIPTLAAIGRYAIQPETVVVQMGGVAELHGNILDASGNLLFAEGGFATALVRDTAIAVLAADMKTLRGRSIGTTRVVGTNGYDFQTYTDSAVVVVRPASRPTLRWSVGTQLSAPAYAAVSSQLEVDSAGAPIPYAGDIFLTTSDTSVSVVPAVLHGVTGATAVTVVSRGRRSAVVSARGDSLLGTLWLAVMDTTMFQRMTLTIPTTMAVGDSAQAAARATDMGGRTWQFPMTWSSSDTTVAAVGPDLLVHARAPGTAVISARSDTVVRRATLAVLAPGPAIGAVPTLLYGQPAVIQGSGFDPSPAGDTVRLDGVLSTVTAASAGQLTIVPPASPAPCIRAHASLLTVKTGGGVAAKGVLLASAPQVQLDVDGEVRISGAALACTELALGGTYDLTVTDSSRSPSDAVALRLYGVGMNLPMLQPSPPAAPAAALRDSIRRAVVRHARLMDRGLAFAAAAGSPLPQLRARRRPALAVGDSISPYVRFKIPRADRPDFCSSYTTVTAERVFTGPHVSVFLDVKLLMLTADSVAGAALGRDFETDAWPTVTQYFGDPLALDSLLDGDGRVTVLMSPVVNDLATSFVAPCDFYPEAMAPSSNVGETIYLSAETAPNGFPGWVTGYWRWIYRTVLVHELKHVASFAERLSRGEGPEADWLEEGSATVAEEIWSRGVYGTSWMGNATYAQTLYCDVRPTTCPGRPYAMFNTFALLYDFANSRADPPGTEAHTPLGPTSSTDGSFYGSAWSLIRWSIDQYAASEAGFLRAMVTDGAHTGTANLEARTGRSWQQLLDDWSLAAVLDGQQVPRQALTYPSWDLQSIFAGMGADFPADFSNGRGYPFGERGPTIGSFDIPVTLHGGSVSIVRVDPATGTTLIAVTGQDGSAAPPGVVMRIIRLR
jgi:hypothetical protein